MAEGQKAEGSQRAKGIVQAQLTHEAEKRQVRDDGLHHLTPGIPARLVPISLPYAVAILIISIRQFTETEDGLCAVILHANCPTSADVISLRMQSVVMQPMTKSFAHTI